LIRDNVFFVIVVFTVIRRGVDVVKQAILWIMLGLGSFTVFAAIVGAERFKMASSLTLVANASSHMQGKDLVDEEG
jgi:hypothetical protein